MKIYDENSRVFLKLGFEALFDDGDNTLREEDFFGIYSEFLRDFFQNNFPEEELEMRGRLRGDLATAGQFWPRKNKQKKNE